MKVQDFYSISVNSDCPWPHRMLMEFVVQTGSTNEDLKQYLKKTTISRVFGRVALRQTSGRGTRGRLWKSDLGGIYFSLAIPCQEFKAKLSVISLAIGFGVVLGLRNRGVEAGLKWPNDIWFNAGKAGGVLCELVRDKDGHRVVVIGIGINLNSQPEITTHGWPIRGIDIGERFCTPESRTSLLSSIVNCVLDVISMDDKKIINSWNSVDFFKDQTIIFSYEHQRIVGRAMGIDEYGRLLLCVDNQIKKFSSGSIISYDNSFD